MNRLRTALFVSVLAATACPATAQDLALQTREQLRQRAREQAERAREQQREQQRDADERRRRLETARGPEVTEPFSRTIRLGRNGTLDLSNIGGDISITGGGGDDLKIDAVKRVRQRSEQAGRELLQQIEIRIAERSGLVEVRTEYPQRNNFWGRVDYTVTLPNSANVTVRTVSGDLRVTNVRGELRADSVSGTVTASNVGRLRAVKTVSGDLNLTDIEGDDISAGAVSGDVIVRNLKARSIDLELISGDIRLAGVTVERANLRTLSGDVDYSGPLARNGRYQMQSQSGDIRLAPAGNNGFDLEANSFNGDIRSDFTLKGEGVSRASGRGPRNRTLRGTFGDAGAAVTLRSFSGDISITRP
jgi:DUF4097 and DUF4098 domain-containing protein YvlB